MKLHKKYSIFSIVVSVVLMLFAGSCSNTITTGSSSSGGAPNEPNLDDYSQTCSGDDVMDGTIKSVKTGNWSDSSTWSGGRVPAAADLVNIAAHTFVTFDISTTNVAGMNVSCGGVLKFNPGKTSTLQSNKNIIVHGILDMRPLSAEVVHTLRFINVDESKFQGGGMDPLDTDVGLWVMDTGRIQFKGTEKTSWTRAAGSVIKNATSITVKDATGWKVGDEIMIVPTTNPPGGNDWDSSKLLPIVPFAAQFERRNIVAINGNTVTIAALNYDHLQVAPTSGKDWTPEVANLTRNVKVEGTKDNIDNFASYHRSHIFIHGSSWQYVKYTEGRYLGPRQIQTGNDRPQLVLGRYALHFHHCFDGSKDSFVEGNSFHEIGTRVYVTHASNGIYLKSNVAFNSYDDAFWWDFQEGSHDITIDGNLIALNSVNGTGGNTSAILLGQGDNDIARNNVSVYSTDGNIHNLGAYMWNTDNESVWTFEDNLAHSSGTCLMVWQNSGQHHLIKNFDSYNCTLGIFHGAYGNPFLYSGGYHYNSPVEIHAAASYSYTGFANVTFDGAGKLDYPLSENESPLPSGDTTKFIQNLFKNYKKAGFLLGVPAGGLGSDAFPKLVDLISNTFSGGSAGSTPYHLEASSLHDGNRLRYQTPAGVAEMSQISGGAVVTSTIPSFAAKVFGPGTGLTANYYNGSNFDTLAFTRVDSSVVFDQWSIDPGSSPFGVDHRITDQSHFSVRWTGKIQPQFSEVYKFKITGSGTFKLWVNGTLIINGANGSGDELLSTPINLIAGQKYDIKIELAVNDARKGIILYWASPSLTDPSGVGNSWNVVGMSQLYPI